MHKQAAATLPHAAQNYALAPISQLNHNQKTAPVLLQLQQPHLHLAAAVLYAQFKSTLMITTNPSLFFLEHAL
jgi:hypothetical protein